MRLTVLGCAGSFPGPDSPASSYLLESEGFRLLLDVGNGALGALQRHVGLYDVDAVFLSHLHADHCMDLCPYYVARKYRRDAPAARLPVYGPRGTAERMARAYDLPNQPGMTEVFDFRDLSPGQQRVGPFSLTVEHVVHPGEAFAARVEADGRSLCYSGDTAPTDALLRLAADVDLALLEAAFHDGEDNPPRLHLTGREAAEHADRAGARSLLLTHLVPWNDPDRTLTEASPAYDGKAELARAGASYDV